jgi:glucosamine--fructose-6-phosphate aminotransferase (isomerizing)
MLDIGTGLVLCGAMTSRMFLEAAEAADAVRRQRVEAGPAIREAGAALRRLAPRAIVTCARGSSDHAATYAKYLIETRLGVSVASAAPSVASVYGDAPDMRGSACIAISQSGASPDLLATAEAAKARGALVVALVNQPLSPLADLADYVIPLSAGPETSIAATKSYIATLSALLALVAEWGGAGEAEPLPDLLDQAWALDWSPLVEALTNAWSLYVVGRGIGLGVAQEAALKLKEVCGLHAEAVSAAEIRHGPMALVAPGFPVLLFRQRDESAAGIDALAADLKGMGATVLVAGAELPAIAAAAEVEPILQIQSFYRAAEALARARGMDPDRSPHLAKVTQTR